MLKVAQLLHSVHLFLLAREEGLQCQVLVEDVLAGISTVQLGKARAFRQLLRALLLLKLCLSEDHGYEE